MANIKKAVIFDMDGVLVDSELEYLQRLVGFLKSKGNFLTLDELAPMVGADDDAMWFILEEILQESFHHATWKKEFKNYLEKHPVHYLEILNTGVIQILKALKQDKYIIGLASSSKLCDISKMLKECQLELYFDVVLSGEMFEKTKPDPAIYKQAVYLLKCNPQDCIVVEDSFFGILAAKRAGLYTIAKKVPYFHVDQTLADVQFTTFEEAYEAIKKRSEI